jgi:16S rRNA (uracil1498-N3)-methyltransferase
LLNFIVILSMNLILLFQDDFIDNTIVRLQGRRLKHVLEVHRASVGDELSVGVLNGQIGVGKITLLSQALLEMEVRLERAPPPALPLTLILVLPRPKVLRRVLRSVSSLGVKKIILLNCFRVEKSFWQSPFLNESSVKEQLILGLEQARDTVLPEVLLRPLFKPFVEDEVPEMIVGTVPIVAHPHANALFPRDLKRTVTLAIGPEGGFIPYEIEKLIACGFTPVQMGERILSVETAVPALIAKLF